MRLALALVLVINLSGCIAYPTRVEVYDADCQAPRPHLTLRYEYLMGGDCPAGQEEGCLALLVGTAAASTVVSGSIVIVGNTYYWLEKQERCEAKKPRSPSRAWPVQT